MIEVGSWELALMSSTYMFVSWLWMANFIDHPLRTRSVFLTLVQGLVSGLSSLVRALHLWKGYFVWVSQTDRSSGEKNTESEVVSVTCCDNYLTFLRLPVLISILSTQSGKYSAIVDTSITYIHRTPPNVHFEVHDVEEPWPHSPDFDFIYCRCVGSAIRDWPKLMDQVLQYVLSFANLPNVSRWLRR